jgi:integrase/recombinase XerD
MDKLFEQFLKEKLYLQNVSPRTIKYFRFCYMSWVRLVGSRPTKQNCNDYVISLRESGISINTINSYIRGLNSFFTWLHENEHISERLRMRPLKAPQRVLKVFSDSQIRLLLSFKPRTFHEHRLHAMVCLALDTGCRVDELITLRKPDVDFQNLLIKVTGKGSKERVVPISLECRKVLFKFLQRHELEFVFPTLHGGKVYYRSALTQFKKLCKRQGIWGVRLSWHTLRHTFATCYLRDGGNIIYLSRILGHTSVNTTQMYVQNNTDDLALVHQKTSLLRRLG